MQLLQLQDEIRSLSAIHDEKPWKEIGTLLYRVFSERIFEDSHKSFSAWLDSFSESEEINTSALRKYFTATHVYAKLHGSLDGFTERFLSSSKLVLLSALYEHDETMALETWPLILEDEISVRELNDRISLAKSGLSLSEAHLQKTQPYYEALMKRYREGEVLEKEKLFGAVLESLQRGGKQSAETLDRLCVDFEIPTEENKEAS